MSPETGRAGIRAFKGCLIGIAFASVLVPASAEERKTTHERVWGPMFRAQVARCWNKPVGGDPAAKVEAAFKISLTRDGALAEQPVAESPANSDSVTAYQKSAIKALNACQPYRLPIEYYEEWKLFTPVFTEDKTKMSPEDKAKFDRKGADALFNSRTPSICRGC